MSEDIEHILRQWGRRIAGAPDAPDPPGEDCLSFARAEAAAREEPVEDDDLRHAAACPRCGRLVADFREAIDEAESRPVAGPRRRSIPLPVRVGAVIAAAAVVLLAVALTWRRNDPDPVLAAAEVGRAADVRAGITTRGRRAFATGEAILFRVVLERAGHLALVVLPDDGPPVALPSPFGEAGSFSGSPLPRGQRLLGPYRLTGPPGGKDVFCLLVSPRPWSEAAGEDPLAAIRANPTADGVRDLARRWGVAVRVFPIRRTAPE